MTDSVVRPDPARFYSWTPRLFAYLKCTLGFLCALTGTFCVAAESAPESSAISAARALVDAGKHDEAQKAFEQLARSDPRNADINFDLGELSLRRNEPEKAITFF